MNWTFNVLLSLVAGSVDSVVFTPLSQRLGEVAKARYTTQRHLHGVLCAYRQELEYQYDRSRTEQHGYPPEFASVEGQEKLSDSAVKFDAQRKRSRGGGIQPQILHTLYM
ncbi:hypothetical protein [Streptomyces sp. NPDC088847]|uniref:hypothetical protein n=1 Tax=Streptomyces sp. NPDC088847 TaxID=3365909 RepID=UPI0038164216